MLGSNKPANDPEQLRRLAREAADGSRIDIDSLSRDDIARLVQEFGMYQNELLTQNEELRQSYRDLEEARQAYAHLFEFAPVGYLTVTERGLIGSANLTASSLLRIERSRLLQRPLSTLFAKGHGGECYRFLNTLFRENREEALESVLLCGDGTELPVRLQAKLRTEDGERFSRIALLDISREKQAEQERKVLMQELSTVLETLPGFVNVVDRELNLLHHNRQMENLVRARGSQKKLIGRKCFEVMHGRRTICPWCRVLEVLRTGEPVSGVLNRKQLEATVASGTESFFKYFFSPIKDAQGRVVEVVKFIADVTDLETAKRRAEEASRVKSDFLAKMSHEIRTPMNSILGMLRLALLDELPGKQRERLQVAKESADSLLGLLNDLLDLSKIEAGRFSLQHMDFSLAKILNNVVREFRPEAQEKGLWLDLHLSDGLPERVEGDPQRLRQILINLISNALKCTHQGGVTVEAERNGHLPGSASEDSRSVELVFRVADTGVGIDPDWADRIFESYEQCGFASSPEQGTGLGLAICKRLIQEMNGRIWVESKPGSGSTFVFALPFVRDGSDSEAKEKTAAQIIFPELPSLHILLVEDERMNQIFTQDLLASSGHSVDLAQNGQEALDMLRRKSYDAVLMDVKMPVMDGVEATLRIRTNDPCEMNPDIPVIGLSAHAVSKEKEQRFNPGFNAYITKPVEFEKLFETLSEVISGRELLARRNVSHRDTD